MKKLSYTIFLFFTIAISQSFGSTNTDLFAEGSTNFEEIFSPLDQLASVVASNPEADLNYVQINFASTISRVSLMDQLMSASRPLADSPVAGISGYIWGACLGLAGIAIVYFLLDDASTAYRKQETTHAVVGCAISTAVWTVLYFALIATSLSGV